MGDAHGKTGAFLLGIEGFQVLLDRLWALGFDVIFSVGTTSVFPYIAEPVWIGRRRGTLTVEINPGQTQVSSVVDVRLERGASEVLDDLCDALATRGRAP